MAERGVVAGPRRVEDDLTAQRSEKLIRLEIEDPRADLDCFDVRGRDRAEGAPVYPEHSFVTWRSPLRGDADNDGATAGRAVPSVPGAVAAKLDTAALALGLVGTPRASAQPTAANAPAPRHARSRKGLPERVNVTAR
jgi:hypothetical protein